mgnify:CR=1 FL=1
MTKVDAILNLHREGEMLLPSFRSIQRNLKDFSGKWLLLFFYPKDDTPG